MIEVHSFTFNPFAENTYLLTFGTEAWIIDPGMYEGKEVYTFFDFISSNGYHPTKLVLTHAHIDHVLGNYEVNEEYGLRPWVHQNELPFLSNMGEMGKQFGMPHIIPSPQPEGFIDESSELSLGGKPVKILFTPGHSPGSLCFYFPSE